MNLPEDYGEVKFLNTTAIRRDAGVLYRLDLPAEWVATRPDVQAWLAEYAVKAWSGSDYLLPAAEEVGFDEKCPDDMAEALLDLFVNEELEGESIVLWLCVGEV